jgi:predicted P-loop ATPase/GTPase
MNLLVAGAQRVDAGKTTFSTGLVAYTGAIGFKPRAGNDYWFDHDDFRHAVERGRLFGKDARTLAAASPGAFEPEEINPIHRLWVPSPGPGTGLLGQEDREFVIDRAGDHYIVNGTMEIPDFAREELPLTDAIRVDSLEAFNRVMERYHLAHLEQLQTNVAATDRAVVESYGDIARPLQEIEPDAVAVVEPLRARLYEGDRYMKACEVATRSPQEGTLEERVGSVVDPIDPETTVDLAPLGSGERDEPDSIADAYEPAYERLLEVAESV